MDRFAFDKSEVSSERNYRQAFGDEVIDGLAMLYFKKAHQAFRGEKFVWRERGPRDLRCRFPGNGDGVWAHGLF